MTVIEQTVVFFVGCVIGFVMGVIYSHLKLIEKKLDVVDEHIIEYESKVDHLHDEKGAWVMPKWLSFSNLALGFVVLLVAWAAFASQRATNTVESDIESDRRELCVSGQDNRHVQRIMVEQIFQLATSSLVRNKDSPPLTAYEFQRYNAYIDRVNKFRESMYRQIKPTDICVDYVTDDDVRPPSPPFPPITNTS